MKETLSLLAVSLAVLIVSTSSFKKVSSATIPQKEINITAEAVETKKPEEQQNKENESSEQAKAEVAAPAETTEQSEEETPSEQSSAAPAPAEEAPAPAPAPVSNEAPAPSVDTSYANVSPYSSAADRLAGASIGSQYTSCGELNNIISGILSRIISPSMSNYEKAKACYSYIILNCDDKRIRQDQNYTGRAGGWNVNAQALALFCEGGGQCDCYSAGFTVLCRAAGLNCSQVEGDIPYFTDHDWCEINSGGIRYIFDPDVEEDVTHSGTENYFCKTYSELSQYTYKRTIG